MIRYIKASDDISKLQDAADRINAIIGHFGEARLSYTGNSVYILMDDIGMYRLDPVGSGWECVFVDDPSGTISRYEDSELEEMAEHLRGISDQMYSSNYSVNAAKALARPIRAAEDDNDLETPDQEYSSAETSINSSKLPAIYKLISLPAGSTGVDFGGGKFDNAVEYLRDKDVTLCVYDPYNRSAEHNKEVLRILRENGGADFAINSNVLNVIKEEDARVAVLRNIKKITKSGAPIYITVYEGSGTGEGKATSKGYQLNRKTADYLEDIQQVFPDAKRKGKLIVATNSGGSANSSRVIKRYSTATKSIQAAKQPFKEYYTMKSRNGNLYGIHYNPVDVWDDEHAAVKAYEAQFRKIAPYDDAPYYWAWARNGAVQFVDPSTRKVVDRMSIFTPSDLDVEPDEWGDEVFDMVTERLDELNSNVEQKIIHNSTKVNKHPVKANRTRYRARPITASNKWDLPEEMIDGDNDGNQYRIKYQPLRIGTSDTSTQELRDSICGTLRAIVEPLNTSGGLVSGWVSNLSMDVCDEDTGEVLDTLPVPTADELDVDLEDYQDSVFQSIMQTLSEYHGQMVEGSMSMKRESITGASSINLARLKESLEKRVMKVAMSDEFGFFEEDVWDYFGVDVRDDGGEAVIATITGEVDYGDLMKLCNACNPIVERYDEGAYFEPVDVGIAEAYILKPGIRASKSYTATPSANKRTISASESDDFDMSDLRLRDISGDILSELQGRLREMFGSDLEVDGIIGDGYLIYTVNHPTNKGIVIDAIDETAAILRQYDPNVDCDIQGGELQAWVRDWLPVEGSCDSDDDKEDIMGAYDDQFTPPDLPDGPHGVANEKIEIEVELKDVQVQVREDGSWDYLDDTWADNPDRADGDWYDEETGIYVADPVEIIENSYELLEPQLPLKPGDYKVSGYLYEAYDLRGMEAYERTSISGQPYDEVVKGSGSAKFNQAESQITNLKVEAI